MRVVLAGGGTAGHINPAISIADTIKKYDYGSEFLFVGTEGGMESSLVPKAGYDIEFIDVSGFKRSLSPKNIASAVKAFKATVKCGKILKKFAPDVVIGTGGYVSGPVLFSASMQKIPTLIHEQNVFAGMTSRILSKRVDSVCISFEKTRESFSDAKNVVLTGNPIRENLFDLTYTDARKKLNCDEKPLVVAFGGSLGARRLNEVMTDFIKDMKDDRYNVIFATGEREFDSVMKNLDGIKRPTVSVKKYIYNMDETMQAADLLVCRAGAVTVSEITALKKPSVLIPSPNVTDNHQYYNAKALFDVGASLLIEEKDLSSERFERDLKALLDDREKLNKMGENSGKIGIKNATDLIYNEIKNIVGQNGILK